jgi:tRNA threonylcarbamoyladenosine biosynthesis protein TsaE
MTRIETVASRQFEFETSSVGETSDLGCRIGAELEAGDVLELIGSLGAGKTAFVRGLARGLSCPDHARVNSPTYVLEQIYEGRLELHHYDAYRIGSVAEFLALGFDEHLVRGAVCAIEWGDRVAAALPADRLRVEIVVDESDLAKRRIRISGPDERWAARIDRTFRQS